MGTEAVESTNTVANTVANMGTVTGTVAGTGVEDASRIQAADTQSTTCHVNLHLSLCKENRLCLGLKCDVLSSCYLEMLMPNKDE
ncbi:hypothetical protein CesoFtcFv8_027407 [Champsocephalus esox]|uniref:Uncharacterized protein n=1 Tax=Champsocephalus esox TaxID=159716 RepID=A0AAN8AY88_9TELE|nr:hypothetical protein CesoFtcFv8_027407 [Champsocephalus esox]